MSFFEVNCDMTALAENYRLLEDKIGDFFAVVKCNAYGHGLKESVLTLCEAGCQSFAVAQSNEAILVRKLAPNAEILLLSRAKKCEISELFEKNITLTVFSAEYAKELLPFVKKDSKLHLKTEMSMNRSGLRFCEFENDFFGLAGNVFGIYTHLPRAFDKSETLDTVHRFEQIAKYTEQCIGRKLVKHCAASQAAIEIPEARLDACRVGLALYGAYPCEGIAPVMTAKSRVIGVHAAKKGEFVGYGDAFLCSRDTVIATVCGGYADGLLRSGKNRLTAVINGCLIRICGTPCMDRTMFDVTTMSENGKNVRIGDEVNFFGRDKSVTETACECDTIPYEILTSVGGKACI